MITLQDVAKRAGVAPITVSRVVNNSGYVALEVRQRVQRAIADLGYVPNTLARSLRSRQTNTLALILTDITNPFFTTVARGVEDAASDAGFMVIFCNTDERESEEEKYLRMLLQKRVDGILLVPARSGAHSLPLIQQQGTAVVVLDRRVENAQVDVVRCDSEEAACELGRLLLSLGHTEIVLLAGPPGVSTSEDRIAGFRRALAEAGMPLRGRILHGEFTQESGYMMAEQVLALTPRPTALFAANNFIAIGAFKALEEQGIRVPEEMALVAFDDIPPSLVIAPFLTVASQPAYAMGQKAVERLLQRLRNEGPEECQEILLPTELILRRSSGEKRA
ncbi:MAG TPA: LacI family DNA-binding transcriptional regulator [Chthonomonadaceae bacterium]|nr:LacI family DNA-binding transcriptional regulator [Chthonomonadaceae bacterium]